MKTVTSTQMREVERMAIEELGIPSIILMENAAIRLATHCFRLMENLSAGGSANKNAKVLITCGSGNNGGDGLALARILYLKGIDIKVIYMGDTDRGSAVKNDASLNLAIVKNLGITILQVHSAGDFPDIKNEIEKCDFIVDALFGIGLTRNIDGNFKMLIETINRYAKFVLSVDMPSGVHSDTGRIMGCAVKANETVTFAHPKTGLYVFPGAEYAGKISIEDIGIPYNLIDKIKIEAEILTDDEALKMIPVRAQRSNKGSFGKVLVFAGSNEMPGAAAFACSASYMVGAGLVCACVVPHTADVIHHWQREVITRNVPELNGMYCKKSFENLQEEINRADVIVIGPGIGRSSDVTEFVRGLLGMINTPVVLDADALFALGENIDVLKTLKAPCVITPHPGEMSRLTGRGTREILDNIVETAVNFSKEFNIITLLKDAHTIIAAPDGKYFINLTGNNALSKAGTGDVLTGVIAGFIAQMNAKCVLADDESRRNVFNAAVLGAYYHGKAGEDAAEKSSCYEVMAEDLLAELESIIFD